MLNNLKFSNSSRLNGRIDHSSLFLVIFKYCIILHKTLGMFLVHRPFTELESIDPFKSYSKFPLKNFFEHPIIDNIEMFSIYF